MIILRPYQIYIIDKIIDAIRNGYEKILVVMPMGCGKTLTLSALLSKLTYSFNFRNNIVLTPFTNLVDQVNKQFTELGLSFTCDTYQGGINHTDRNIDCLVLDESHHSLSPSWGQMFNTLNCKVIVGFTATPYRLDKKPLLKINGGIFETLIEGPDLETLIKEKYIADYDYYVYPLVRRVTKKPIIFMYDIVGYFENEHHVIDDKTEDVVTEYINNFKDMQGIVFCKSVEHASIVSDMFNSVGIGAGNINCYRAKKETKNTLQKFRDNKLTILSACNMASEGLDIPAIKLGIMARKISMSYTLFLQQAGRFLRPHNNERAQILDLVGNYYRFGSLEEAYRKERV